MNLKPQATTSSRRSKDRTAQTSWGSSVKPTVTRLSPAARQDYVTNKQAQPLQAALTYSGMLHQSRTLESPAADKPQDRHETRRGRGLNSRNLVSNLVEVREAALAASVTNSVRKAGVESWRSNPARQGLTIAPDVNSFSSPNQQTSLPPAPSLPTMGRVSAKNN